MKRLIPRWAISLSLLFCTADQIALPPPARSLVSANNTFDEQAIYDVRIELLPTDMKALREDSRKYVPARLCIDGAFRGKAGIHLKGKASFRDIDNRPSFTVDFARFSPEQGFQGLRKIHLNNSVEDPSRLREWIGTKLFRAAGVPAPRVTHALVALNGRALGLYVLKEGFSEDFTLANFGRTDGRFYECQDGAGPDPAGSPTGSGLAALAAAAREPDLNTRWQWLEETLDVDRFISFMAVEIIACHWDGYSLARNNYRVYQDSGTKRVTFLPTGMDQLLANPALTSEPEMAGFIARALLDIPEARTRYRGRVRELLTEHFDPVNLAREINDRLARLRPGLSARAFAELREEAGRLRKQIAQRHHFLICELARPAIPVLSVGPDGTILTGWRTADVPDSRQILQLPGGNDRVGLHITAGPKTAASWHSTVRLGRGHYRFQGLARVQNLTPLPFGKHHGCTLRVRGSARSSSRLLGSSGWKPLQVDFDVSQPQAEVDLVCEVRAGGGEAWFDPTSLRLLRLGEATPPRSKQRLLPQPGFAPEICSRAADPVPTAGVRQLRTL